MKSSARKPASWCPGRDRRAGEHGHRPRVGQEISVRDAELVASQHAVTELTGTTDVPGGH